VKDEKEEHKSSAGPVLSTLLSGYVKGEDEDDDNREEGRTLVKDEGRDRSRSPRRKSHACDQRGQLAAGDEDRATASSAAASGSTPVDVGSVQGSSVYRQSVGMVSSQSPSKAVPEPIDDKAAAAAAAVAAAATAIQQDKDAMRAALERLKKGGTPSVAPLGAITRADPGVSLTSNSSKAEAAAPPFFVQKTNLRSDIMALAAKLGATPYEDIEANLKVLQELERTPASVDILNEARLGILTQSLKDHPNELVRSITVRLRSSWKRLIRDTNAWRGGNAPAGGDGPAEEVAEATNVTHDVAMDAPIVNVDVEAVPDATVVEDSTEPVWFAKPVEPGEEDVDVCPPCPTADTDRPSHDEAEAPDDMDVEGDVTDDVPKAITGKNEELSAKQAQPQGKVPAKIQIASVRTLPVAREPSPGPEREEKPDPEELARAEMEEFRAEKCLDFLPTAGIVDFSVPMETVPEAPVASTSKTSAPVCGPAEPPWIPRTPEPADGAAPGSPLDGAANPEISEAKKAMIAAALTRVAVLPSPDWPTFGWLPEGHCCGLCQKQVIEHGAVVCGRRRKDGTLVGCRSAVCWRCMNQLPQEQLGKVRTTKAEFQSMEAGEAWWMHEACMSDEDKKDYYRGDGEADADDGEEGEKEEKEGPFEWEKKGPAEAEEVGKDVQAPALFLDWESAAV